MSLNGTSIGCLMSALRYSTSHQHTLEATDPQFIHYGSATVNAKHGKSIFKNSPILLACRSSLYESRTHTGQTLSNLYLFGVSFSGEGSLGEGSREKDLLEKGPRKGLPVSGSPALRLSGSGSPTLQLWRGVPGEVSQERRVT